MVKNINIDTTEYQSNTDIYKGWIDPDANQIAGRDYRALRKNINIKESGPIVGAKLEEKVYPSKLRLCLNAFQPAPWLEERNFLTSRREMNIMGRWGKNAQQ